MASHNHLHKSKYKGYRGTSAIFVSEDLASLSEQIMWPGLPARLKPSQHLPPLSLCLGGASLTSGTILHECGEALGSPGLPPHAGVPVAFCQKLLEESQPL